MESFNRSRVKFKQNCAQLLEASLSDAHAGHIQISGYYRRLASAVGDRQESREMMPYAENALATRRAGKRAPS